MPPSPEQKKWLKKILGSKLILAGTLVLLVLISTTLGKAVHKRYQIQKEIEAIRQEIENVEGKNQELARFIDYFATEAFQEKMARQKLNLKREGENVVIVPVPKQNEEMILGTEKEKQESQNNLNSNLASYFDNPKKWWHYFFAP